MAFITLFSTQLFSQDSGHQPFKYNSNVQLELGGHGVYYSVSMENFFINTPRYKASLQQGVSFYPESTGLRQLWVPIMFNQLLSFKNHHAELGFGTVFTLDYLDARTEFFNSVPHNYSFIIAPRIGYRFQPPNSRFFGRIGFTPFIEKYWSLWEFRPSGGATIGFNF